MVNGFGKFAFVMRIADVEPIDNELCGLAVLGEHNRLTEAVPANNFDTVAQKMLQDFINGVFIEEPFVQFRTFNALRDTAILIPFNGIPLFLFLIAQLIVVDPVTLEF